MSSSIKSLAVLIAMVGLAVASYAGLVNGESLPKVGGGGGFESLHSAGFLQVLCKSPYSDPDKAIMLLKKLDKIYAGLDDDAKINRNEQKIVEQFAINQINGDQFCTGENLEQLVQLSGCFHRKFGSIQSHDGTYLDAGQDNFAFVCRSYALKYLDKRVGEMNEMHRQDMETRLGNKLVLLVESNEDMVQSVYKRKLKMFSVDTEIIEEISAKWMDVLFEFLKEKSGTNFDAKSYITTGDEGRLKFYKLFQDSVAGMCQSWMDATEEAETFAEHDERQEEDRTEKQASWIKYADVCSDIKMYRKLLAKSMYIKMGGKI